MKKSLFSIFFLFLPLVLSAQWFGNGKTPATAYYGVINASNPMLSWNTTNYPPVDYPGGVIYVGQSTSGYEDLTVSTGGTLTIEQGITVKFCTTISDLIITSTGILNASTSTANGILFTKNSQASWGHISFQTMDVSAGPSTINNCLITYGDVSSAPGVDNPNHYGGAIQADISNLTISNCEFHNNKAGWGGAIFIGDGRYPTISNCYIHDNTATTSGGGIYFWKNSYPSFTNSIVIYNSCTGSGGGGGIFIGGTAKNVKVINCVISHNSASNQTLGHNVKIFNNTNTPKPQFINSIIWYPANSIVGSSYAADFLNCAIQDPPLTTYTGCVSLNSSNTGLNPPGPYFKTMSGADWSIAVISPCRDAGTTPSPTVPTDYIGNSRISAYDIGAYEVQYNGWRTTASSTDWSTAGNWDLGVPTSSQNVVIRSGATNYPTGNVSLNYTVGTGYGLVLDPGAKATFDVLTKNGDLKLRSDAVGISSLIVNNSVSSIVELYLAGGGTQTTYKWHYISIPVSTLPVSTFNAVTLDIVGYAEPRVTTDLLQGWVAWDGYVYVNGSTDNAYKFTDLIPGKGYDYWDNATPGTKFTFSGQLNSSALSPITLTHGSYPTLSGWNLLGNPFPSGIDWDVVTASGYPANTGKAVYFTKDNVQYTYAAGTGIPENATSHIPPMQGFFIRTYGTGNTFSVPAAAKEHNTTARYKGAKSLIPLVRLKLTEDSISDETVVRFDETAKFDLDYDFDATKSFYSLESPGIWSAITGTKYAINGQPFPDSGTTLSIPITVNLTADTLIHSITASQLQGLDDYNVSLFDNVTGFTANLKTTPTLTFTASPGLITDRFTLKFSDVLTGIENPVTSKNIFNIYSGFGFINIQTLSDDWDGKQGSIIVHDLSGRTITDLRNIGFSKNSVTRVTAPSTTGLYIVELRSGVNRYVGKVVIR
jgi:hypothetical protein